MSNTIYGNLSPSGRLATPAVGHVEELIDQRTATVVAAGRPDIAATTPYTQSQLNAMPSGTVYRSTDGPQGAWEWMKQGNAWVVTQGDTGWRAVPLINGWTGTPLLRRTATDAYLKLSTETGRLSGSEATANAFLALPVGFRITANNYNVMGFLSTFGGSSITIVQQSTDHQLHASQRVDELTGLIHWLPWQAWPATLPGTSA